MTRFIKDAFKITPVQILGKAKADESIDNIVTLLKERIVDLSKIPCDGWVCFQDAKYRDALDADSTIEAITLSNGTKIVIATSIVETINTQLRSSMKPVSYLNLPEDEKYKIIPFDYVFFNNSNGDLICLVSAISEKSIKVCINEFLKKNPFADAGFTIIDKPDYLRIPDDLFKWLFYKYYENQKISNNISIKTVHLADGNTPFPINSRIKLRYEGKSAFTYLYELKFSIADKRTFNRGGFDLEIDGHVFKFILDDNGCVEFSPSTCIYNPEEPDVSLNNFSKAIYIFNTIIPQIKGAYLKDTMWAHEKEKFLLKCAEQCKEELEEQCKTALEKQCKAELEMNI